MRHLLLVAMTGCASSVLADGPVKAIVPVANSIGMNFVPIPTGTFTMGLSNGVHRETLKTSFHMGQHEVTQEQYEKVMGKNPSTFKGEQLPVETVSYVDAVEFCRKLSALPEERSAGYVYRLPTEAEWEYACRAGTTTKYSFGDDNEQAGDYEWNRDNSGGKTHPIGQKKCNAWGLYDMNGNVCEWCLGRYGDYPGYDVPAINRSYARERVVRGLNYAVPSRAYNWGTRGYTDRTGHRGKGFRVVRTLASKPTKAGDPVLNSIGMHLVPIPAGTFTRGQGDSAHKVTLTQAFHLGQYEVTQEQYKQVTGSNPSGFKEDRRPVETVNWNEAVEFCRKLSAMPQEKSAGFIYRLPTDAEWEYASRAGTTTGFSFGDASAEMGNYGWLTSNSQETTHPVGQKNPNPWGLYDMYGNVWEWCLDWDGRRSSGRSVPVTDPTGPASGSLRVFRGGGWKSSPRNCRPDNRGKLAEVYRGNTLGFRVVRTLARPVSQPAR